jgi:hypothetical protein
MDDAATLCDNNSVWDLMNDLVAIKSDNKNRIEFECRIDSEKRDGLTRKCDTEYSLEFENSMDVDFPFDFDK